MSISKRLVTTFTALSVSTALSTAVSAREQWQMQHPDGPAPTGPVTSASFSNAIVDPGKSQMSGAPTSFAPGLVAAPGNPPGLSGAASIPGLSMPGQNRAGNRMPTPELIQQIMSSRLPVGTMLTGIVADDLSSRKSMPNDLFSIILADGYYANGVEVIPVNSRIVGTVVGVAQARASRGVGQPGHLEVALTTLVFPDGRSTKITAFIDRNVSHDLLQAPKVRTASMDWGDYKRDVSSFLGSFTSGLGGVRRMRDRGADFMLRAGALVPVRLTSSIDLNAMTPPTVATQPLPATAAPLVAPAIGTTSGATLNQSLGQPLSAPNNFFTPGGSTSPIPGAGPVLPLDLPDPF